MSFTVVLNSANIAGGTLPNSCQYSFDWSVFEDCPYKVNLSFLSQDMVNISESLFIVSIPDLGVNLNTYTAGASTTANSSSVVALISPSYYVADGGTNIQFLKGKSVFSIPNKPRSTTFTVFIKNVDGTLFPAGAINYIMTLYFEKV